MGDIYFFKSGRNLALIPEIGNKKSHICHCNSFFHLFTALMLFDSLVNKQHQFTRLPLKRTRQVGRILKYTQYVMNRQVNLFHITVTQHNPRGLFIPLQLSNFNSSASHPPSPLLACGTYE